MIGALLTITLLATVLTVTASVPAASAAGKVATSACRGSNPHLRTGVCFRFPDGRVTWLGNFTSASGKVFFCIDKNKDSRLPAKAPRRSTRGLKNQYGKSIGRREVAALNYLIDRWGTGANATTAAAIGLIVRQVMSDTGGQMPAGLTVGEKVADLRGGLPGPVLARARAIWREASQLRGPWSLRINGSLNGMEPGQRRQVTATVLSAAGHRVPRVPVRLWSTGAAAVPRSATTTRDGRARLLVRATRVGRLTVTGSISGPSGDGLLFVPRDRRIQRGWIAERSGARDTVSGVRGEVTPTQPTLITSTSSTVVPAGAPFHDVVTVRGLPSGTTATLTARLYGPYPVQPSATDCQAAQLVATRSRTIAGDGSYPLGETSQRIGGLYVWVASLSGTALTRPATHPCGVVAETTRVERNQPTLRTRVSAQRAGIGSRLSDSIVVAGLLAGERVQVVWGLYGPLRPNTRGTCAGLVWQGALLHDSGSLEVSGNGVVTTGPTAAVRATGCYSFGERLVATPVVAGVVHPPGLVTQSTVVQRSRPTVRTQTSAQVAVRGARLRDTVWIAGLWPGERVRVHWQLVTAPSPRRGSCANLNWVAALRAGKARVFDRGSFTVPGDGRYRTRLSKRTTAAQCYTYSERIAASATTEGAWHRPGKVSQTTLVRKPGRPTVPSGPEGWLRRLAADARTGAGLSMPAIGATDVRVRAVGSSRGGVALPRDAAVVGWWRGSAPLGATQGASLIAGHVGATDGAPGALSRLREIEVGDRIVWRSAAKRATFTVVRKSYTARTDDLPRRVWRLRGPRTLNLITCARKVRYPSGFYHYTHNLTVTARLRSIRAVRR
ncbi:sortase domain-bontaining protein [Nocardioides sp. Bht2]|uniref:sortase domain-containing protein n=1 Tax=Nocardioides sp. Bht2 TaxID=3392297 RepID=UPI0039B4B1E0